MTKTERFAANAVSQLMQRLNPDRRFVVCDYSMLSYAEGIEISFKVSSIYLYQKIKSFFQKLEQPRGIGIKVSVDRIPALESHSFALCNSPVAPVMASASHQSEQITQMLIGETADILDQKGDDWVRVRLHADEYIGWVSTNQMFVATGEQYRDWLDLEKGTTLSLSLPILRKPAENSEKIRELFAGTSLPVVRRRGEWSALRLPDGLTGWVSTKELTRSQEAPDATSDTIIATARSFLGIPYIWGGRSVKGFDCSGFIQTVFRLHGIELPRDASLQHKCGTSLGRDADDLCEGDLMFFSADGTKITHVAISLGEEGAFIHSSGFVRINSIQEGHPLFDKYRADTYIGGRRIGSV